MIPRPGARGVLDSRVMPEARVHQLLATPDTVHFGGFSPRLPPALTIASGDAVDAETFTGFHAADHPAAPEAFRHPRLLEIVERLPAERRIADGAHLLTGPIAVRGAEPGDWLEVGLERIEPGLPVGYNAIREGWGVLRDRFSEPRMWFVELDEDRRSFEFPRGSGVRVPVEPFFGELGVAPAGGEASSIPPGRFGGNLDNRELRAGARLFLPVQVKGALFSLGDGHAAQGDGEVDSFGLEISMNGRVRLTVRKELAGLDGSANWPFALTPTHLVAMGFAATLDEALEAALSQAVTLLGALAGLAAERAYALASLAMSFRVTQAVNTPMRGVHGMLPLSVLPRPIGL